MCRTMRRGEAASSDAWSAVLHLAEHLIGGAVAGSTSAQHAGPLPDLTGAAAQAYVGDSGDVAADVRRLRGYGDGVWVVDDGLPLDARAAALVGVPGGMVGRARRAPGKGLPPLPEMQRQHDEDLDGSRPCALEGDSSGRKVGGEGRVEGEEGKDAGWLYSSGFPLGHGDSVLMPAVRLQPEPLHFVRWRRWLRRRCLRTVERRVVRVEASSAVPGTCEAMEEWVSTARACVRASMSMHACARSRLACLWVYLEHVARSYCCCCCCCCYGSFCAAEVARRRITGVALMPLIMAEREEESVFGYSNRNKVSAHAK